jgi:hypothetical protein
MALGIGSAKCQTMNNLYKILKNERDGTAITCDA